MARRVGGDGRLRWALEDGGAALWDCSIRFVGWKGQAGGAQDYGPPCSNRRGRAKGAEKSPDAAMAPTGGGGVLPAHVSSLIGLFSSRRV